MAQVEHKIKYNKIATKTESMMTVQTDFQTSASIDLSQLSIL